MSNIPQPNDKIGILDPDGINFNPLNNKPYTDIYKQTAQKWSKFPIYNRASEIIESINKYQICFIVSGTGSGKSVLIPKFALHYTNYRGKIGMTLPKRLITMSTAIYAATSLDVELGNQVGYLFKGSDRKMVGDDNKILYMTDGILISKFVKDPLLSEFQVIIVDEAHERKVQIDLIMLFLKKLLESGKRPDLRVIIMSATIDISKYQNYFDDAASKVINVSGQPNYEIQVHFLDNPSRSFMHDGFELIKKLISEKVKGDILFFITTSNEAMQLCSKFKSQYSQVFCIEVYAEMDKNLEIYAKSRNKYLELGNYDKKIVMATNVAESSLTIEGLIYVIDSGHELYSYFDPLCRGQVLEKRLITKAQALQRRGRVGRTEPGIAYHLLTKSQFDALTDYPAPDILKEDITLDMLKIMLLTESKTLPQTLDFLSELMDPPKSSFIESATELFLMYNLIDNNGKITKMGYLVSQFSSDAINRSLFLICAYQEHCAREASIILALLDKSKGKINNLFYKDTDVSVSRKLIKKIANPKSDHLTLLNLYTEFKNSSDKKSWSKKYNIKFNLLHTIDDVSNSYYYKIINLFKAPSELSRTVNVDVKKNLVNALIKSHVHATAAKMMPVHSKKRIIGQINKDSVLHYKYNKSELANHKFIYDKLTNTNGSWEYSIVTLI